MIGLLLACSLWAGCRTAPRLGVTETGAPRYERATVVYELDGFQRPLPLNMNEITPVSFESALASEQSAPTGWASATLSIQYPHPDGSLDKAQATLRLSSQSRQSSEHAAPPSSLFGLDLLGTRGAPAADATPAAVEAGLPQPDDEIWVLDFPKQQLDLLLSDLSGSGFFAAQTRNDPGTHLDVQVDRGRTEKAWTPEPRLDHFVARVYREGRLGGFVPCHGPNG